ncbi:MAG: hypothetical protein MUF36_02875 [Bacteroidales bacterium]|jgi:hypothetical protein|nr:hypothetical protein [Bacteroidales bacterium]
MKTNFLIFLFLSAGLTAMGQFEKIIQPSDLKQKTIITESTTLSKGFFRAELGVMYLVQDKYFDSSGKKQYYPVSMWGSRYQYTLGLKYGISDRFEADIRLPFINQRIENYFMLKMPVVNQDSSFSSDLKGTGIGDCNLMLKYQIIPERGKRMTLTLFGDVTFPTGPKNPTDIKSFNDYKLPTGVGHFSTGIWLYARKIIYPYSFTAFMNYNYNFWGSKLIDAEATTPTKFRKGNLLMISGSFNFHLNDWIALANEIYYFHYGKGEEKNGSTVVTDPNWTIDYVPRLVFQIRRFRIYEIVDVPLFGKDNGADPAYSITMQYTF